MARILLVEDEPEQLSIRQQLFELSGYQVVTAQSGAAAVPKLAGCQVVLMDLRIPSLEDGLNLIREANAAAVRVIVLSGAETDDTLPVDAFLTKPCPSRKMLETVARFCTKATGA